MFQRKVLVLGRNKLVRTVLLVVEMSIDSVVCSCSTYVS